jgi:hypothetical protein
MELYMFSLRVSSVLKLHPALLIENALEALVLQLELAAGYPCSTEAETDSVPVLEKIHV